MSDEERPRRSWREIDQQRDRSTHRSEAPQRGDPRRRDPRRQRSYRAQLDHLFESGKIGELVQQQAPELAESPDSDSRIKALQRISVVEGRAEVTRAVDAYLEAFGELPRDFDVLARVLEHRNPTRQLDAMELLDSMLEQDSPRRTRAIVGQLKLIRDTSDEPEMADLARKLLGVLE